MNHSRNRKSFHVLYRFFIFIFSGLVLLVYYTCVSNISINLRYLQLSQTFCDNKSAFEFRKSIDEFNKLILDYCPVTDYNSGYTCLGHLSKFDVSFDSQYSQVIYHHTFWKIDENKPHHLRVLILQILSFLATQDLTQCKFIIWIQNRFSDKVNKVLTEKFEYYLTRTTVEIRILNFTDLCSNGLFKAHYKQCVSANNGNSVAFSDFIRFLVLYKYGGIYTDGDVFYLRDMRPFWSKNFVHRWSFTEDYNTAIMGLQLNRSSSIEAIYKFILENNHDLVSGFYPARVKDTIYQINNGNIYHYKDFEVYHSILFDPAWLCNDGVLPRFNNITVCVFREFYDTVITAKEFNIEKFYGGAFSFHLHLGNCGKCTIDSTSFFYHIENYFIKKIGKNINKSKK